MRGYEGERWGWEEGKDVWVVNVGAMKRERVFRFSPPSASGKGAGGIGPHPIAVGYRGSNRFLFCFSPPSASGKGAGGIGPHPIAVGYRGSNRFLSAFLPFPLQGRGNRAGDKMPVKGVVRGRKVSRVKVRRARALRREMTEAEAMLWQYLRGNRLEGFHFGRQQVIEGFIVDFYCHAVGLVVEVDGGMHRDQREYDTERDSVLRAQGLRVLRIQNEDVRGDLKGVLKRILTHLTRSSCIS